MKKALSLSLSLSSVKSLQFNRVILALFLACVMAAGSMLSMFAVPQARANPGDIGRAVFAWGQGTSGQLGDNNAQNSNVPIGIPQLTALECSRFCLVPFQAASS